MRERYQPERIRLLFVAESPPAPTADEVRFFYNAELERWDHMYRAVMQAVFPSFEYRPGEKDKWLRRFKANGYYVIDAIDEPVNHLPRKHRDALLLAAVEPRVREIEKLVSRRTPIVLVKKNIFSLFKPRLCEEGFRVIHDAFLPFPSHGHQSEFIAGLRKCLHNSAAKARSQ